MLPLVSVIIPVYNRLDYLHQAIESVLAQSYGRVEIIVVDDGSALPVAGELQRYGNRLTCLRQENRGLPAARNFGVSAAQGEFLAFLDDDDLFLPEKLERQAAILRQRPEVGLVYSDEYQLDAAGRLAENSFWCHRQPPLPSGWIAREFFCSSFIGVMSVLVRRSVFDEMGGFDETLLYNEDDDLWFRIMLRHQAVCCDYVSGARRLHGSNMSRDITKMTHYQLACIAKYLGLYPEFVLQHSEAVRSRVRSLLAAYLKGSLRRLRLPSSHVIRSGIVVERTLNALLRQETTQDSVIG